MMQPLKPEELVKEVPARSGGMIFFTVLVTLVALALGLIACVAFGSLLAAWSHGATPPREESVGFAILFVIFAFFLRTSLLSIIRVMTGRMSRAPLIPWWFAGLFAIAVLGVGIWGSVLSLSHGDYRGLAHATKALAIGVALALSVGYLRRVQVSQRTAQS